MSTKTILYFYLKSTENGTEGVSNVHEHCKNRQTLNQQVIKILTIVIIKDNIKPI